MRLPAAPVGAENPLPPLRAPEETHTVSADAREGLPRDMARQLRYEPLRGLLPVRLLDGYGRERTETVLDTLVIENSRVRATVLPSFGGRVHSLLHRPTGRELVYSNPVFQPADFALNGAWFSGGIEWNIGATGHSMLSCAPVHAAVVTAPDGGEMLRLWEWERLRDLPFQVDLWLPEDSDFLHVGVRVRNPHEKPAPLYWWSNTAVPEDRRVLAPADSAWHFGYERTLRKVTVPVADGLDRTRPPLAPHSADYFYDVPDTQRRWIAALDGDGHGLAQTSTDRLRGRKLFVWGSGTGGRRWQRWLTEPGTDGYAEIQAGLARTQLEHVRLDAESDISWLETYGPLSADPAAVHGDDWPAARAETAARLEEAMPRERVDAAYEAWLACADSEPGERLATGSGWGALEVLRGGFKLPGTPFAESEFGDEQGPWLELLRAGTFPRSASDGRPPGPTLVSPHWRDMLETAGDDPLTEYHLGIAQWHADDRAQAVRSWERALESGPAHWPLLRCLAVADAEAGNKGRAADRYEAAFDGLRAARDETDPGADAEWEPATTALARETIDALLLARRTDRARTVWERLPAETRARGRFRLIEARLLLAEGDRPAARAVFDEGFEVADLREAAETLNEVWAQATGGKGAEPLPEHYDFRMRAGEA
ncbi:DUF5107 domain-containing protein [Streptomyces tsukubensis]|uniref:DUF5107 domain-containing protein n=1 Tax=Streptomyces tsukubensis TaxID=83656 RepID=A0A1V4ADB5_9ACTN|nr:DUF5107 domain-containing protein [Streptomyces tsukubensis]